MHDKKLLEPLKLNTEEKAGTWHFVLLYVILGYCWILFSDRLLAKMAPDVEVMTAIQTAKGWLFVIVSATILYMLLRRNDKKNIKLNKSIIEKNEELQAYTEETLAMESALQDQLNQLNGMSEAQRQQKDFLDQIIKSSNTAIAIWSLDGKIIDGNQAYKDLVGYGDDIIGRDWLEMTIPENEQIDMEAYLKGVIDNKQVKNIENTILRKDGTTRDTVWNDVVIYNPVIEEEVGVSFGIDVTKEKSHEKEIYNLAFYDRLTGLKNRVYFEKDVKRFIEEGKSFHIYYLDVDNFKNLNDIHGHYYGDLFLKAFGEALDSKLEKLLLYRWGGDEFTIIDLYNIGDEVEAVTKEVLDITHRTWQLDGVEFHTSTSMGVVRCPEHGKDLTTVFKNLEIALYRAKETGRSRCVFFDSAFADYIERKSLIEGTINEALKNEEFYLNFQPIYDMKTRKMERLEILIRFTNNNDLNTHIGEIIGVAEQTGQIHRIDDWVVKEAFCILEKYARCFDRLKLAVNISAQTFSSESFVPYLQQLLDIYDVDPANIEFEITEHTIVNNIEDSYKTMNKIKDLGFKMALDDFGTRYSSLNYLSRLPFDVLKVDKSYVDKVTHQTNDYKIVRQIIALAKSLGLETVAEGIEEEDQERVLAELDCDYGQGYHYSRPLAMERIIEEYGIL